MTKGLNKKLAAILYADVVGYSKLSHENEEATHRLLFECLDLIASQVRKHDGKVLNTAGDAVLAEFSSAIGAVTCAIDVQREVATHNRGTPVANRIQFRIGVNLGDVIVDRNEIFGDGVNVAARLETLAEPGGICISRKILHEVRQKLEVGFEFIGNKEVKNIPEPVPAYRVLMDPSKAGQVVGENATAQTSRVQPKSAIGRMPVLAVIVSAFFAVSALLYVNFADYIGQRSGTTDKSIGVETALEDVPTNDLASATKEPLKAAASNQSNPNKPSIAVLPFDNLSNDPNQEYFSDGITEDLITDLAQIAGLRVIARNSVFTYKGRPVKVQDVAEDLGVNHVLEGSIRKVGNKVRFNVQLVDALSGDHIWAERFDRKLEDIFDLQDEVCERIVSSLKLKLTDREKEDLYKKYTQNVDAYELFLQGQREFFRFNLEGNLEARRLYALAADLDPSFARAIANLGWTHARDYQDGWSSSPEQSLEIALKLAKQAIDLDPTSSQAQWVLGQVLLYKQRYSDALDAASRSIELSPSNPDPKILLARILAFAGDSKKSVQLIEEATDTNPFYPMQYMMNLGIAHFVGGEYEKARIALTKAIERNPDAQRVRMWLVATHANAGQIDDARWEYEELLTLNPSFSIESVERSIPFKNPIVREKLVTGIKAALDQ